MILLAGFAGVVTLLAVGLRLDPDELPSQLIGRPLPDFDLPALRGEEGEQGERGEQGEQGEQDERGEQDEQGETRRLSKESMIGQPMLLNVFASWCVACVREHPLLVGLSERFPVYGLNYKDDREAALNWLAERGDPYRDIARDADGAVGIDFGVYGVPESYVLDKDGIVLYRHVGPLTREDIDQTVLPLLTAGGG